MFTNGVLYAISVFGIYFIASNYLSKLASFFAAFIFIFYGWTLFYTHFTYSETATSVFCIWTILFLIKSDCFQKRKYAILFGLFFGFGLLTRWITIVFVLGPLIYVFYQFLKKRLFKKRPVLLNILFSFLIVLLLSAYPYYLNSYWVFFILF
ncbi:MAG: glycosyltransferase family 39 protein [Patescibacteria group bacterium]|nr:glycosyltransferase family 39 protein [Patescibacteria group bacterium]